MYIYKVIFCYLTEGNLIEAVTAAETYLLLIPDDPTMSQNVHFYKNQPAVVGKEIIPRPVSSIHIPDVSDVKPFTCMPRM